MLKGGVTMTGVRMDCNGQALFRGEYLRKDGRYEYRYVNRYGKTKWIYANRLSELRGEEAKILFLEHLEVKKMFVDKTLDNQFEIWKMSKVNLKEQTREGYEYLYNAYIRGKLGKRYLDEITTFDIKCHYSALVVDKRVSCETIGKVQNVLFQIFRSAKEAGFILSNPAEQAARDFERDHSKHSSNRKGIFKEEADLLLDFVKKSEAYNHWYPLIYFFINTGMRISEMAGLRWQDINYKNRELSVDHAIIYCNRTHNKKARLKAAPPKTAAGYRKIPLKKKAFTLLEQEKEYQSSENIVCKSVVDGYTDFVFLTREGTPITQAPINRALERIVQAFNDSDIHNKQGKIVILPKLTTHSFRHTFANILCEENVNLKVMQMLLGQSDISTTLDIYTRVNEEFVRREFSSKWR